MPNFAFCRAEAFGYNGIPLPLVIHELRLLECRQVMSDNGPAYVSRSFAKACKALGLKQIRTKPYTPRTNGKAERFIQTLCREWAYGIEVGTFYWTTAAPEIVSSGREEQVSVSA